MILIEINLNELVHATKGCRLQFDEFLRMLAMRLLVEKNRVPHLLSD